MLTKDRCRTVSWACRFPGDKMSWELYPLPKPSNTYGSQFTRHNMYINTTFLCTWVHGVMSWINYGISLRRESNFLNLLTYGSEAKLEWKIMSISEATGQSSLSGSHGFNLAKCPIEFLTHEVTSHKVGGHKGQLSIQRNLSLWRYSPLNRQSFAHQSAHWSAVHFGIVWPRPRILSCASTSVPGRYSVDRSEHLIVVWLAEKLSDMIRTTISYFYQMLIIILPSSILGWGYKLGSSRWSWSMKMVFLLKGLRRDAHVNQIHWLVILHIAGSH